MDTYNHNQYARMLANSLRFLEHSGDRKLFFAPNSDSLFAISQQLSSIAHSILVAIDGKDSDFDDTISDTLGKRSQYFFMFLHPARIDDVDDILRAQSEAEAVAMQVQVRMLNDSRAYRNGLTQLLQDTYTIRSIGPVGDNLFGVIMGFNVRTNAALKINPDMWL